MLSFLPNVNLESLTDGSPLANMLLIVMTVSLGGYLLLRYGEFLLLFAVTAALCLPLILEF